MPRARAPTAAGEGQAAGRPSTGLWRAREDPPRDPPADRRLPDRATTSSCPRAITRPSSSTRHWSPRSRRSPRAWATSSRSTSPPGRPTSCCRPGPARSSWPTAWLARSSRPILVYATKGFTWPGSPGQAARRVHALRRQGQQGPDRRGSHHDGRDNPPADADGRAGARHRSSVSAASGSARRKVDLGKDVFSLREAGLPDLRDDGSMPALRAGPAAQRRSSRAPSRQQRKRSASPRPRRRPSTRARRRAGARKGAPAAGQEAIGSEDRTGCGGRHERRVHGRLEGLPQTLEPPR